MLQLSKDIAYTSLFGAMTIGAIGIGIPASGALALVGLYALDAAQNWIRRNNGTHIYTKNHANKLLEKIKAVSGLKDGELIDAIKNQIKSPYTTNEHIKNAQSIVSVIEQYINKKLPKGTLKERQELFGELLKGGHFVFENDSSAYVLAKSGSKRASSHYKAKKIEQIKLEVKQIEGILNGSNPREELSKQENINLLEYFSKPNEVLEQLKSTGCDKKALYEQAKAFAQSCIQSLSKTDGFAQLNHIDTDFSFSAGLIFKELLMGKVKVNQDTIVWGQLEGHSHHRDPSTEGPLERLFSATLNILSLNGRLFSYNSNKLGHHIDFLRYWFNGKTRNVGQYGTSAMTEKAYLQGLAQRQKQEAKPASFPIPTSVTYPAQNRKKGRPSVTVKLDQQTTTLRRSLRKK